MADRGTFETVLAEIGQALLPLRQALSSPGAFAAFLVKLGWITDQIPQPLADLRDGVETLYDELRRVLGDDAVNVGSAMAASAPAAASPDDLARVLHAVQEIISAVRAIETAPASAIPPALAADGFATAFPIQLLDYLVVTYLQRFHSQIAFALRALGIVKVTYAPPAGGRPSHMHVALDLADLPTTLRSPEVILHNAFGWGDADFDFSAFASQVDNLLTTLMVDTVASAVPTDQYLAISGADADPDQPRITALKAIIFQRVRAGASMSAGIRLLPLPADGARMPGFAVLPGFDGMLDVAFALTDTMTVTASSDLDLQGGVGLLIRPGEPVSVITGFANAGAPTSATGSIVVQAALTAGSTGAAAADPTILLGTAGGTRLQVAGVLGAGGVRLVDGPGGGTVDVYAEFALTGLQFTVAPGESDGFIASLLPAGGLSFGGDLTVGVSHHDGFYFRGTSHLAIQVPAHVHVGPIDVNALTISANPTDGGLPIGLGATLAANLGPIRAVVDQIGLVATVTFPSGGGNLGPLDVDVSFQPPKGVGLSISAGAVSGGGYLAFDSAQGEYSGAVALTVADTLALTAIGLIDTKQPDGTAGFSLLVLVSTQFATGIQLGFGFRLTAVGGLLGLNRSMDLAALTDGVSTGTLQTMMFPADVITAAPTILTHLRTFFPARPGTFLVGPMAKLEWGTPTLVQLTVGVIIEIPGNVALVGVLTIAVPSVGPKIVQLNAQFVGAIEFDKQRLYFYAKLVNSKIAGITLAGDLGLLVDWSDDGTLVLSVGGFHPAFAVPPLPFPALNRVSLDLLNSSVARVRAEGYFAVTADTVQFGAAIDLFFGLDGFTVTGHLSLDALFHSPPFGFEADFAVSLSVTVFGIGLFSVQISGTLTGTSPWHIVGHGGISLLFWSLGVDFDHTWGEEIGAALDTVAVLPLLLAELAKPDAWHALPPAANQPSVTVARTDPAVLILDPVGGVRVSQKAVPLDIPIDRIGDAQPTDANRLSLAVGGTGLARTDDATEQFALGQFENLTDAQRLSQPAFTPQHSGLDLTCDGADLRTSGMARRSARYEEIIIDAHFTRAARPLRPFPASLFTHFLGANAATRAPGSQATAAAMRPPGSVIAIAAETYSVASVDTNQAHATFASAALATDYLAHQDGAVAGTLHVIPTFEAAP